MIISASAVLLARNPASFQVSDKLTGSKRRQDPPEAGESDCLHFSGHYKRFQTYMKEVTSFIWNDNISE